MVTPEEQALIADRMAEAGISNMGAYMRKMALNGYVLHVDLSDIRELVALQRRCANNLNQVAVHANTYGIYPSEITALQKGLCQPLGATVRTAEKVVGCGKYVKHGELDLIVHAPRIFMYRVHPNPRPLPI